MIARKFRDLVYRELTEIGKAIADPRRLELIDLLCQSEKNVELLSEEIGMSLASTSHHLQILKKSKLTVDRKEGRFVLYRASSMGMELWKALAEVGERNLSEIKMAVLSFFCSEQYGTVDFRELRRKVKRDEILLLDVRPKKEYISGHFPGAISIPLKELEERINSLPRDRQIVAYCRGRYCVLSESAVEILRKHGREAYRLPQGVVDWRLEGARLEYTQSKSIA